MDNITTRQGVDGYSGEGGSGRAAAGPMPLDKIGGNQRVDERCGTEMPDSPYRQTEENNKIRAIVAAERARDQQQRRSRMLINGQHPYSYVIARELRECRDRLDALQIVQDEITRCGETLWDDTLRVHQALVQLGY